MITEPKSAEVLFYFLFSKKTLTLEALESLDVQSI